MGQIAFIISPSYTRPASRACFIGDYAGGLHRNCDCAQILGHSTKIAKNKETNEQAKFWIKVSYINRGIL